MYSIRGIKLLPPAVRAERRIACGEFSLAHGAHLVALQKKRRGPTHAALCWSGNSGGGGSGGNGGGDGGNGGGEDGDERPGGPLGFVALVSLAAVAGLTAAPAGKTEAAAVAANQDDPEEEPTRLSIEQLTDGVLTLRRLMREVFAEFVGVRSRLAALEEPLEAAARQGTSQTAKVSVSGRVTYAAALLGGLFEDVEEEAEVGGAGTGSGNLVSPGELQPPITPDRSSLATTLSLRSPAPLGRGSAVPPNLQEAAELLFGEGYQPGAVLNLQMEASPSGSARDKLVARFVAGGVRAAPACLRSLVYKARLGEGIGLMVAPMGSCVRDACPQLHPNSGVGLTRLMRDGSPLMQVMAGPGIAATWRVRELSLTAAKLFSGAAGSGPRHSMTISQITLSPSHFFSAAVYGMQVNGPQEQAPSPRRWPVSPVPVRGALAALGIGIEAEQTAGGVSDPFATPIDLSPRGGGAATASCSSAGATATWAATDWLLASAWGCLHLRAGEGRRHGPSWGIKLCSSPEGGGSSWGIALGRGLTADPPGSASASLDDSLGLPALLRAPADSCSQPLLAEASMRLQVADGWTVTPAVLAISGEGHGSWAIGLQSQLCF